MEIHIREIGEKLRPAILAYNDQSGETLTIISDRGDLAKVFHRPEIQEAGISPLHEDLAPDELEEIETALRGAVGFWQCEKIDGDVRKWWVEVDLLDRTVKLRYENF